MKGDSYYFKALKQAQLKQPDLLLAYKYLLIAHEKGNFKATYALASWFLHGKYLKKNLKKGVSFLKISTQGNVPEAFYDLAVCYEKGKGIKSNKDEAFHCYLKAALLGDKQSLYEVGRCYFYGIGVRKDKQMASNWLDIAKHFGIEE